MNIKFEDAKEEIIKLIKDKNEITNRTDFKTGGIYLLYVDNFDSEKIIPAYIGKTHNFQERHKEHLKEILSINRLTKKNHTSAIISKYYEVHYKSSKFFKYLVDNENSLNDIHMVILEECDDEDTKIIYNSGCKSLIKNYKSIESFVIKKIIKQLNK